MKTKNISIVGTREWATHNENIQLGCENDCLYCYAKGNACRYGRTTPDRWGNPEINQLKTRKHFRKRAGRIMFPTSHDITPTNLSACTAFLREMLKPGNDLLIVSKPRVDCVTHLCQVLAAYRRQITFRFTIGSASDTALRFWEPQAPSFMERLDSLMYAYEQGFETSVSCEPMLDGNVETVVSAVAPYVTDTIWIGLPNHLKQRLKLNGHTDPETMERAEQLLSVFADEYIRALHVRRKHNSKIRWKDSIKKALGLARPTEAGLDV